MNLVRMLYASEVAPSFDPADLDDILEHARKRNIEEGMTGVLFFTTTHFIQCLEGESKAVNTLYNDMMSDPRHNDLTVLFYQSVDERMFSSWQMAYIGPNELDQDILAAYSLGPTFDPYAITEERAIAMLKLLVEEIEGQDV